MRKPNNDETMRTVFFYVLLLSLASLLTACGGQPTAPSQPTAPEATSAEQIQQLLNQADASESPRREELQLEAVAQLLQAGQLGPADQIMQSIQPDALPSNLYVRHAELSARLQMARQNYQAARLALETPRLVNLVDTLPLDQQIAIGLLQADIYARLGSYLSSAQRRIYLAPLLKGQQKEDNHRAIWRSLMHVPIQDLHKYNKAGYGSDYQGWLKLALIARENQGDLDQQVKQLEQWQQQWPDHPANKKLPGELALIKELAAHRPKHVALLLPLSGKLAAYGRAVRDGFIAALYRTRQHGGQVPSLKIYDTEKSPVFYDLYQQAVDDGAELIVGPLEKRRLKELFQQMSLPVPTLALNRGEEFGLQPLNLYQFGLAPEDEAKQVADIAFAQHHRTAMIISPRGEWGDKVSGAFVQRWQKLGGVVVAQSLYTGQRDYSSSIKDALLLQDSENRAKRIERLIGQKVEFVPRRREDIDMVFLLARPQQARSITPLLAYHYAGDLPVYGTSRLYTGYPDPKRDRDLNGVMFTDMPWVLNPPTPLHREISAEISHSRPYQRMYALGVDSFQVYPRLRQLEQIPNSRVFGQTGILKLDHFDAIERESLFAQIQGGRAKLIPIADRLLNEQGGG